MRKRFAGEIKSVEELEKHIGTAFTLYEIRKGAKAIFKQRVHPCHKFHKVNYIGLIIGPPGSYTIGALCFESPQFFYFVNYWHAYACALQLGLKGRDLIPYGGNH